MQKALQIINFIRDFLGSVFLFIAMTIASKDFKDIMNKSIKIGLDVQLKAHQKLLKEYKK